MSWVCLVSASKEPGCVYSTTMGTHNRKPSSSGHHHQNASQTASPSKHQRNHTAPATPTLLRIPSSSSAGNSTSPRSRRATNPSTPTLTPSVTAVSTSSATSPSYFSPQPAASGKEARSPATRRPPASFSGHGIDNSRGPPIALITRGTGDIARRSQKTNDFAFAQQQLLQLGLVSPGGTSHNSAGHRGRKDASGDSAESTLQTQTPNLSRQNSTRTQRREQHMASSVTDSSEYDSGIRSQPGDTLPGHNHHGTTISSGTDGEPGEDLFLNIAQDSPPKESVAGGMTGIDRRRSRIARASNRNSFPSNAFSSPASQSNSITPNASRIPSSIGTKSGTQYRRTSHLPSPSIRNQREQSPLSPANVLGTPRTRHLGLSPQASFSSSKSKEQEHSPHFIPQFGRRRPSYPDAVQTPPNRTNTYRPSNLHYSSSRDNDETPHIDTPQDTANNQTYSHPDGSESLDSTGPAASVWDELDDLKSRIRRIELGGKMPTTSAAVVSNGSGDRPRTATTSNTTVSSSPKHHRKTSGSPAEVTPGARQTHKVHPLLHDALAKAKQQLSPSVYRVLEATASEALELAGLTGSAGPQGTTFSASSIINGATLPDRQVRRKADNICRGLTELCIALCGTKTNIASPAIRDTATANSRRPSVQINGESPSVRASIEPESGGVPRNSPSRAMSRIEARRSSLMAYTGSPRESSQEPPTPSQSNIPSRFNRAGTSLRARRTGEEDDDDPTLRAPSRAMTDFRDTRSSNKTNRFSREYTSREPIPELQPSPSIQHTSSLRRPTVPGASTENSNLLFRDGSRRFNSDRQNSPAYESLLTADAGSRATQPLTQYSSNRTSLGASGLSRAGSLSRRLRGNVAGE
ncbi:hypothetical protein K469DRAFT_615165 [Zopfia rhizophila CBS 207.26]|uniref:Uncharacterized protein n=1 Tax=Zopfia rhizophila CBS 207.26 TaxID=1314779 RepID=A0A6A6EVE0_9PEZI|nr:hypothetical protein K469DRAFT_615165 [Zopfia rhizophila CBS 207.26]